jgi:hypothetical protein
MEAPLEKLSALLEQLKSEGITPKVALTIPVDGADIPGIKALQSSLLEAGITPEIQITISVGEAQPPAPKPDADFSGEKSVEAVVNVDKTNCMTFTTTDKAGKPIFEIPEPRVHLFRGDRLRVSAEHQASDKDPGDGTIIGTGGIRFYFVVDCSTRQEAKGLYVKQSDVTVV